MDDGSSPLGGQGATTSEEEGDTAWDIALAVPPSKALRDGVHFRGLRVSLFVVDDDEDEEEEVRVCLFC